MSNTIKQEHALVVQHSTEFSKPYEDELNGMMDWPGVQIETVKDREQFVALASDAAKHIKRVKAFFKQTREPFKQAMDAHRAMEKDELKVPISFVNAVKVGVEDYDDKIRKQNELRAKQAEKATGKPAGPLRPAPSPMLAVPKGTREFSTKKIPTASVVDVKKVCGLIAKGELPESMVAFSQASLNALAKQWGKELDDKYPGLAFKEKLSSSIG